MLSKGRRKYIATICERFATVAFAAAFASGLFAQVPAPLRSVLIGCIALVMFLGLWAAVD